MVNHILLNNIVYRIEEKSVEKPTKWIEKEKEDYEKCLRELTELNKLKEKYLTSLRFSVWPLLSEKTF